MEITLNMEEEISNFKNPHNPHYKYMHNAQSQKIP